MNIEVTIPAARKLIADAEAAGHSVNVSRSHVFLNVTVHNTDTKTAIAAEWWDGSIVREFNMAATFLTDGGVHGSRRAKSLRAARAHIGI